MNPELFPLTTHLFEEHKVSICIASEMDWNAKEIIDRHTSGLDIPKWVTRTREYADNDKTVWYTWEWKTTRQSNEKADQE